MNTTKCNDNHRSEQLDQMIQTAIQEWRPEHFTRRKDEIIDFIMANLDLPITYDQFVFLLRYSSPAVSPMRNDYFDVLARLVSEAKTHEDPQLVKSIYLSIPFYPVDKDCQEKRKFYQSGIQYFLLLGLHQIVGELYTHLASMYESTTERIALCQKALGYLNQTSKEYACVSAMREMLCHMEHQGNDEYYHYWAFGETIFRKEASIFLSPIYPCFAFRKKSESLCFDVVILKGNRESYKTLTSLNSSGYDKELVDETMAVGTSKYFFEEKELVRHSDERVICQADGKEYLCHVFTIRRAENPDNMTLRDIIETNYYADGIGVIRTVLSIGDKTWIYDLCEYTIKGGDGMIPCCVGNQWYYRQEECPEFVDQVIKREILAQNGEGYVLAGWNYAGRNSFEGSDPNEGECLSEIT